MAYQTIQDPGIAQGFQNLSSIFTPNPESLINADLAAKRRDLLLAQTTGANLSNTRTQGYMDAQRKLGEILTANPDLALPENRAKLIATLSQTENGIQYGPQFATGAMTFVQPNAVNEQDLSTILLGTGVVKDYGSTPEGMNRNNANAVILNNADNSSMMDRQTSVNANALELQRLKNAGDMDVERFKYEHPAAATPGSVPLVSAGQADKLWEMANEQIMAKYPNAAGVDPTAAQELRVRIAKEFQNTKNAEQAIANILSGVGFQENYSGAFDFFTPEGNLTLKPGTFDPAPGTAVPAPVPGQTSSQPVQPADVVQPQQPANDALAQARQIVAQDPQTYDLQVNPNTGKVRVVNRKNGQITPIN